MKRFVDITALTATLFLAAACSERGFKGEIWSESVMTALGGAISALRGTNGEIAQIDTTPKPLRMFEDWLSPMRLAHAAASCASTQPTNMTCVPLGPGPTGPAQYLEVHYPDCESTASARVFGQIRYNMGSAAACTAALATGMYAYGIANAPFVVTRTIGRGASGDQNQVRLAKNNEFLYGYTDYPSGFQTTLQNVPITQPQGGHEFTIQASGVVDVRVLGLHYLGQQDRDQAYLADKSTLALPTLPADTGRRTIWDHTVNSIETAGTVLFDIGPVLSADGSGKLGFGTTDFNGATTTAAGRIRITPTGGGTFTIAPGMIMRTQHNHTSSVGITLIETELVYGNVNCPFPTSGEIRTTYDRQLVSPGLEERIVFKSTCGEITYSHPSGVSADTTMYHSL